jgi:hypothetical protein
MSIRPLRAEDLPAADRAYRAAFAAQFGITPAEFRPGTEVLGLRWRGQPQCCFAAERNGVVVGSVAVEAGGRLVGTPQVSAPGLFEPDDPESRVLAGEFSAAVADLPLPLRRDDEALRDAARAALRRAVGRRLQKRPLVDVHVLRV